MSAVNAVNAHKRLCDVYSPMINYRMIDTSNLEYTEIYEWVNKYTTGNWGYDFFKIGFELESDAVLFLLVH